MKMKSRLINVELYIRILATNVTVTASPKTTKSTSNKVAANTTATNTKVKELSVYGMLAKKVGVSTNSNGEPYITNKIDSDSALSQSEIQGVLSEISNFAYAYIECKEITKNRCYSETDYITTEYTDDDGELHNTKWYKICSGEITRYSEFESALNRLFSSQMIDSISERINSCYLNSDNDIYISEYAGYDGGVMGLDTVEIVSYEKVESTIIVHLKAVGDKDYWELAQDNIVFFDVVLSKDDGEWKLHQCELTELLYLAWLYN